MTNRINQHLSQTDSIKAEHYNPHEEIIHKRAIVLYFIGSPKGT